mgnify:CR=1 FL=1
MALLEIHARVYSLGTRELQAAKPCKMKGLEPRSPEFSKTVKNRTRGGAHDEYRGGPGSPAGFCSPGDGFLVLLAVVACRYVDYH